MFESSRTVTMLEKSLDAATLRQRVIANNIANINTPGFKRSYVTFEESILRMLKKDGSLHMTRTNAGHLGGTPPGIEIGVKRDENTSLRNEENNVDLDVEMSRLAMNALNYNAIVAQLNQRMAMQRLVISGGRR